MTFVKQGYKTITYKNLYEAVYNVNKQPNDYTRMRFHRILQENWSWVTFSLI